MKEKLMELEELLAEFNASLSTLICIEGAVNYPGADYSGNVGPALCTLAATMKKQFDGISQIVNEIGEAVDGETD